MTKKAVSAVLRDTRSPAAQKAFIGAFAEPIVILHEHPPCQMFSTKTITLDDNEFSRIDPPLLDVPPPDPLRRAAESIELGTKMTAPQIEWARHHDWFVQATSDGTLIVVDHFTYKDRAYSERIIWGGTFAELRDWAGY